jgi:hypothetical protein
LVLEETPFGPGMRTSGIFPRQAPNDDSYAVNSVNVGPSSDAIKNELIPAIEKSSALWVQIWTRLSTADRPAGGKRSPCMFSIPTTMAEPLRFVLTPSTFHAFTNFNPYVDKNVFIC